MERLSHRENYNFIVKGLTFTLKQVICIQHICLQNKNWNLIWFPYLWVKSNNKCENVALIIKFKKKGFIANKKAKSKK